MTEIALRSYLHEIEKFIENGRPEQAIAHVRYILQFYPKYVNAYRLLGKALFESRRYTDASDIFQRVLSSVPDDFASNFSMSVIREDEGNLDSAISHMERAFEVQPSNTAVQEELRRLITLRDQVAPSKIRLTRGALARLYFKGELYQQAISEIRAVLNDDPDRLDLQTILAEVYLATDQQVEAADTALAVLRRLPNCMKAMKVMVEVLEGTEREIELSSYKQRLAQLDPYTQYLQPDEQDPDSVPDQKISIEKLEWKPEDVLDDQNQPAWASSLGVDIEEPASALSDGVPTWLENDTKESDFEAQSSTPNATLRDDETEPQTPPTQVQTNNFENPIPEASEPEEVPDWLAEAGWRPTDSSVESHELTIEDESVFWAEKKDVEENNETVLEAEIPEWLAEIKPHDNDSFTIGNEEDLTPWLDNLIPPVEGDTNDSLPLQQTPFTLEDNLLQSNNEEKTEQDLPGEEEFDIEVATSDISDDAIEPASEAGEPEKSILSEDEWLIELNGTDIAEVKPEEIDNTSDTVEELLDWLPLSASQTEATTTQITETEDSLKKNTIEFEENVFDDSAFTANNLSNVEAPDWLLNGEPGEVGGEEPEAVVAEEIPSWLIEMQRAQASSKFPVDDQTEDLFEDLFPEETQDRLDAITGDTEPTRIQPVSQETQEDAQGEVEPVSMAGEKSLEAEVFDSTEKIAPESLSEAVNKALEEAFAWLMSFQIEEPTAQYKQNHDDSKLPNSLHESDVSGLFGEVIFHNVDEDEDSLVDQDLSTHEESIMPDEKNLNEAPEEIEAFVETAESISIEDQLQPTIMTDEPGWVEPEDVFETGAQPSSNKDELLDQDDAFAWLESLAVQQEAAETVITPLEERDKEIPDWVMQHAQEAEIETPQQTSVSELKEKTSQVAEGILDEDYLGSEPQAESDIELQDTADESKFLPIEVSEESAVTDHEEPLSEPETSAAEAQAEIPELPDWLREQENTPKAEISWVAEPAPGEILDLNSATLSELEHLPGLGFVDALKISDYRENNGPFEKVEDLELVPDLGSETIAAIKDYLFVNPKTPPEASEPVNTPQESAIWLRETRSLSMELAKARDALRSGNLHRAMEAYGQLISANLELFQIAQDLEDTSHHYPNEVDVWQNLGDVYLRLNRVQDALQAFIKAEQLLG